MSERREPRGGPDAHESRGDDNGSPFGDTVSQRYLSGIVSTFVVLAIAVFLMVALLGVIGGPEVSADVDQNLTDQQQEQQQKQYANQQVSLAMLISPYVALAVAALVGLLVGTNLAREGGDKILVSAVGSFLGVFLFVVLVVFLTSTQIPTFQGQPDQTVDVGQLVINALVIGLAGAVVSAAGAYFGDRTVPLADSR